MTEFIKDLLNLVIQHSKNLLPILELVTTLLVLLAAIIILLRSALTNRRLSKYDAKHSIQKKEGSEVLLIGALDLVINAMRLFLGR